MRNAVVRACAVVALALPIGLSAQSRVFIMKLGSDTVGFERVVRTGNKIEGVIVRHIPAPSMVKYSLVLAKDGHVESFEQGSYRADGTPNPPNPRSGAAAVGLRMTFAGDTVVREVPVNGQPVIRRTAVPKGTLPAIGGSWFVYELEVEAARKSGRAYVISFAATANSAVSPDILVITRDSAEIVTQGFRTGIKTDKHGRLVHGDGSLTTQKLDVTPEKKDVDVVALAAKWGAAAAVHPAAPTNTPDSVIATIGSAHIRILYSRPAKRGRELWGKLVPFDTTWRLGADYATQLKTDADLYIGGTKVKAGTYTLWLLPSQGQSYLLVNTKVLDPRDTTRRLWGTEWDPADDIAKIPVQKHRNLPAEEERFHMFIENGMLMMHWGNSGYGVSIKAN
ncbi:MAG: DUF2911 domain-containing protein [Gemmatimonadaceae bacterium]